MKPNALNNPIAVSATIPTTACRSIAGVRPARSEDANRGCAGDSPRLISGYETVDRTWLGRKCRGVGHPTFRHVTVTYRGSTVRSRHDDRYPRKVTDDHDRHSVAGRM